MSKKLNLRNLLALIAIPPVLLLAFIAAFGLSSAFLDGSAAELKRDALTLGVVAIAGMLLSVGMVLVIGKRILGPIGEVSEAARELADVRLPLLIESLSNPGVSMPQFEPLAVSGQTELAQLGGALNSLQDRAVTVANEQQRVVKEGISELVVNLARRNQSLLDRQIENIDALESTEEDPDRLESLFRLDHLATRMRRNAESLLVLAGAEPSRRRGGPVVLADVIRVAMSEIEDYQHVNMGDVKTAHIGPQGAVDVAHLMSELLENATQFSPPDAPVAVSGIFDINGFYEILVQDHGIGMSAEQLSTANQTIVNPPELGLALTRSLGFQVIGRLAQRLGVEVTLTHTDGGGTTASVKIPGGALSSGAAANVPAAFQSMTGNAPVPTAVPQQNPLGAPPQHGAESPFQPSPIQQPVQAQPAPTPAHVQQPAPAAFAPEPSPRQVPAPVAQPAQQAPAVFEQPAQQAPAVFEQPAQQAPAVFEQPAQQAPAAFEQPTPAPAAFEQPTPAPAPIPDAFQQPAPRPAPEVFEPPAPQPFQQPAREVFEQPAPQPFQQPAREVFEQPAPQPFQQPAPQPAPQAFQQPAPQAERPAAAVPEAFQPQAPAGWEAPAAPNNAAPPASMAQAIPSGQAFDQGVDALLDDPANRTNTGLRKRDRSRSQAPASEGRAIPAAGAAPAAASSRSPEEIRNMLARYRDGLKGRPDGGQGPN